MSLSKVSLLRRAQINYLINLKETRKKRKKSLALGKATFELKTFSVAGVNFSQEFKPVYLTQPHSSGTNDEKVKKILNGLSLKLDFYSLSILIGSCGLVYLIIVYALHVTLGGGLELTSDFLRELNFATSVITQTLLSTSTLSLEASNPQDLRFLTIQRLVKEILIL